jgi:hypothetical protein
MDSTTKLLINATARATADATVKRTLLSLGVDASSPREVRKFQQDIAWLHRFRSFMQSASAKIMIGALSVALTLVGAGAGHLINSTLERLS